MSRMTVAQLSEKVDQLADAVGILVQAQASQTLSEDTTETSVAGSLADLRKTGYTLPKEDFKKVLANRIAKAIEVAKKNGVEYTLNYVQGKGQTRGSKRDYVLFHKTQNVPKGNTPIATVSPKGKITKLVEFGEYKAA